MRPARRETELTMNLRFYIGLGLAVGLAGLAPVSGKAADRPINFKELYELLRTQLAGLDEAALNRAAVQGLLDQLKTRVQVLDQAPPSAQTNGPALTSSNVFDRAYAYLRVTRVAAGLDQQLERAWAQLSATNPLRGLILDLRFAGGQDYAAAAAVADRFFTEEKPLLDWGQGTRRATPKTNAIPGPVVLLVNSDTSGAAEALAAVLRHHQVALLIGHHTAGDAYGLREFTLTTGHRVRLGVAPIKVGRGDPIPPGGLKPDIHVEVPRDQERLWYQDPYAEPRGTTLAAAGPAAESTLTGTNRPARRRLTEAELVRMMREGQTPDSVGPPPTSARPPASDGPVLRDPALVRALDLLKGLTVVRHFRPSS